MNLIDKIKSVFKKREADAPPGEPAARVTTPPKNRVKEALIGGIVLGLICAAAWMSWRWWNSQHKIAAPVSVAQAPAKPILAPPVPAPVAAPSAASGVETAQPIAASPSAPEHKESGQEMEAAASNPVQERDIPPRAKPQATANRQKHHKAAPLAAPDTENMEPGDEGAAIPVPEGSVDKQVKPLSLQQQADNEFRRASGLMQQGRADEALSGYEAALQLDAGHEAARQALAVMLLQSNRNADAERVLQDGLKLNIKHSGFAMLLARIQLDRDASWSALLTLQKTLPYAERQADYRAFVAALLQRLSRHKEAVVHYQAAVQLSPNSSVWWMGLGISLKALQRNEEARVAFKRALELHTLNTDLQTFVTQQLKGL